MNPVISPRDRILSPLTLALGALIWCLAIYALVAIGGARAIGVALATVLMVTVFGFLAYVFTHSAFIAHLRGNGIEVTPAQLPGLHGQFVQCCATLGLEKRPRFFVMNGNGVLNAFATWFLGSKFVVLLSNVVDAMDENPSGVRFYIGHELGHVVRHDNPFVWVLRWPAAHLPLLGAAFSRARESTCDLHGLACSESREGAARSLLALAAGAKRWQHLSLDGLDAQVSAGTGFWMSFHELTSSYPWTSKRAVRVLHESPQIPGRNPLAYLLAAFVPYAGRLGSGMGMLLYVYVIGVLAAVAIPAYQDYTARAVFTQALATSAPARAALGAHYQKAKEIPESLESIGVDAVGPNGTELSLDHKGMVLTVKTPRGSLVFVPSQNADGSVDWKCGGGPGSKPAQLPPACR